MFADSVSKMGLDDARNILKGGDDTATQYFRKTCETRLREGFLPLGRAAPDLKGYVTDRALEGLSRMVAEE